jgi:hypothetical protein
MKEVACAAREEIAKYPRNNVRQLIKQAGLSANTLWKIFSNMAPDLTPVIS